MHRSRIAVVLIDHPEESYDAAAAFWAAAHGAFADGSPVTDADAPAARNRVRASPAVRPVRSVRDPPSSCQPPLRPGDE